MNIISIVFSPTGGTKKVADIITKNWGDQIPRIDLCDADTDFSSISISSEDMVLIAMPSFGGRAPKTAIDRLKLLKGNGASCTLVCVYGNRAYEDTLTEMEDTAKESGFQVIAAIAAIAQHSIFPQYATGRPDSSDEKMLSKFAEQIKQSSGIAKQIPGNRPYKKSGAGLVPKSNSSCNQCGMCAKKCPVLAINANDFSTDAKKCISCMRCVSICSRQARVVNKVMKGIACAAIKKSCSARKENELFL